jgi:hypothetical protein
LLHAGNTGLATRIPGDEDHVKATFRDRVLVVAVGLAEKTFGPVARDGVSDPPACHKASFALEIREGENKENDQSATVRFAAVVDTMEL